MQLLTQDQRAQLAANYATNHDPATGFEVDAPVDHLPVVKFFNPCSSGTWLFSMMAPGDVLYGLCDLGWGCPELGDMSLDEMAAVKIKPFGLGIERDRHFTANKTLGAYAAEAREAGHIVA
tara:strand:+ start:961 stop:1323 length:363 start_codon:yes stop_codon:yes gene_type:complete